MYQYRLHTQSFRFFHEPTRSDTRYSYGRSYAEHGKVVLHAPSHTGYGTAVMERCGGKWRVIMQSFNYDQRAWEVAAAQDARSRRGTASSRFYNFYSQPTVDVHAEESVAQTLRSSMFSRRAAMGYDD